jgi:hypothetical protein
MRKLFVLPIALAWGLCASAQQSNSVKGVVFDTLNKQPLYKAIISVLTAKDSMLVKFARTDAKGQFGISDLPAGSYILLTTFPNYADYTDTFSVNNGRSVDAGIIPLITRAHLLQEVVVKQTLSAIRMKGDTTIFIADSFKVQPNASVEDLLKIIPGIQVDKNGKITAQGQTVPKVLVDGEEFFGDDPTLVTQNIRADMVSQVQLFDKKSDQANFTGIDDGQRTKTINLKLKDDKKKGYFGKIDAGVGTNNFYNAQGMFNRFRQKEKLSFYGIFSNTGKIGLNWQDQRSYGDNSTGIEGDGENYNDGNRDDLENWSGGYNGQGLPTVQTGGAHYNNKWKDDKQAINGNYKILDLSVTGKSETNTQYILPDTLYYVNQRQVFRNQILRNKGNMVYDIDFDTTSTLKIVADGGWDHKTTAANYYTESLAEDSSMVNRGARRISTDGITGSFNTAMMWRKKFRKRGRTITITGKQNYSTGESTGYLYADNEFFIDGTPVSSSITDQYRVNNNKLFALDARTTYTEPLSTKASLIFNYGITVNNNSSERNSYNKDVSGKYDSLDNIFSNDYAFNILTQRGGINFSFIKKKLRFGFGNSTGFTRFSQTDQRNGIEVQRNFVNWFPQGSFAYNFSNQHAIYLNYNGATQQPSIQQIQPLFTNDDPLNIVVGNPLLKPSFRNNFYVSYYNYKPLSGTDLYVNANFSNASNAFASSDYVDSIGRRISQTINVNGNYNFSGYISYGRKIGSFNTGLTPQFNQSQFVNVVNKLQNTTISRNYIMGFYVGKQVEKVYDNSISATATYTTSNSSIQKDVTTNYWTWNIRPDLDFYFPWKLQLHTDCDFIFRQRTSVFEDNNNVILWNAWLGKKLLAGDAMVIKISANDILNQNIGFRRTANTNYISQNTWSSIQRYVMLSVVWNFNKGPKPNQ